MARYLLPSKPNFNHMKSFVSLVMLVFAFTFNAFGQATEADNIADLLKSGNVNGLSNYFMNNIDLTILSSSDVYSKAQATQVTRRFFDENPPNGFEVKHQGKSKMEDYFRIGLLSTSKGNYRVTYFLKNHDGRHLIKKLRIEANDRNF